jgi:hypothetical protein
MKALKLFFLAAWLFSMLLGVAPAAILSAARSPFEPPTGIDLDVTYINRSPMYYAYCVEYPDHLPQLCAGTEDEKRWPEPGELVTFTAHVINKGTQDSPPFDYAWSVDGSQVFTGTLPALAAGAEATAAYDWAWAHGLEGERLTGEHTIGFTVDPQGVIAETYESNNQLVDPTGALSLGMVITPEMYEAYNTPVDDALPFSAEDWLQKQIAAMNSALENSTYPAAPEGAGLQVRINTFTISATDPGYDRSNDGYWFVQDDYRHGASGYYDPSTDIDWGLVHELSHQIGLIDLYASAIYADNVFVLTQDGLPTNFGFDWPRPDLTFGGDIYPHTADEHVYSSHSAGGAYSNLGYRNGYYGVYQYDIPQQNWLSVLDNQGNPAEGVQLELFQRQGPEDWTGHIGLDNTPEISGTTDADGLLLLPNRSAGGGATTHIGHVLQDNPFGLVDTDGTKNRFLVRLSRGEHEEFHWMDVTEFNLAYWSGDTISHTFTIDSHVPPSQAPAVPQITTFQVQRGSVHMCWKQVPGVTGYHVYRADPPDFPYIDASGLLDTTCFDDTLVYSGYGGHIYHVTAVDASGRESAFSRAAFAPNLVNPAALVVTPDGDRLLLDPQNGYAIIHQDASGRYTHTIGSVHYHLENSRFMALREVTEQESGYQLVISHPGDWYDGRQSVRIADETLTPVLEFGEYGSGPGEFDTPAGVAAWGAPCTVEGPYTEDASTSLLLHFDGSYAGTQGEQGNPQGTEFTSARYGEGVLVDETDTLTYTAAGNLDLSQGAVELWVRPQWNGGDNQSYVFFEVGNPYQWSNRMRLTKDGGNNLRFMVWDNSGAETGLAYNVSAWQAGEWHHVAATWDEGQIALYADGTLVDSTSGATMPDTLGSTIYVGSSAWNDLQANALLDELRISNTPRFGNSDTCGRILVADSGNHRLQAFDSFGNFLSAYGSLGSGEGGFNSPQGLAVDVLGRVLVADQGNNRVVILDFDGQDFTWIGELTAGFEAPTALAVREDGHIFVADTGNDRIVELDASGNVAAIYTAPNDGQGWAFQAPRGLVWDMRGALLVADMGNQRVATIWMFKYQVRLPLLVK